MERRLTWGMAAILLAAVISFLPGASALRTDASRPAIAFSTGAIPASTPAAGEPAASREAAPAEMNASTLVQAAPDMAKAADIPEIQPTATATAPQGRGGRVAYLTFDDGPCTKGDSPTQNTTAILDILAKYHIKATFFVMGAHARKHPDLILRQYREGHAIGNHTYSHVNPATTADDKFRGQVSATNRVVKRITGKKPTLFRPPFGKALTKGQHRIGMKICGWDLDTLDWTRKATADRVAKKVEKAAAEGKKRLVILFHDRHADGLEKCIQILIDSGYSFDTMENLYK